MRHVHAKVPRPTWPSQQPIQRKKWQRLFLFLLTIVTAAIWPISAPATRRSRRGSASQSLLSDLFDLFAARTAPPTYIDAGTLAVVPPAGAPLQSTAAWVNRSEVSAWKSKHWSPTAPARSRKNIIRSLKEIGVRDVVEATDGNQAVKLLETGKFDIVFAEWNTQIGQGEELVKSFRRTNAKMPVIVTAPQSKQIDELKKTYPTASNYLTMPFTTEQLQKTVAQCVPSIAG